MTSNPKRSRLFLHGVASGDPQADRVVIWTRVTPEDDLPVAVVWQVALEPDFKSVVASNSAIASDVDDFTVKIDVGGLQPNTRYHYRFEALGEFSAVGRTKTLPVANVGQVRFAQVCCAKLNVGIFNAYSRIADRPDLDFVLHLGDYIYETAEHASASRLSSINVGRAYDPPTECKTLDDYRRRYAQYRLDPDLQRLHQALPMIATVDDHEIADGAWREGSEDHDSEQDGPWSRRRRAALQARWEWLPLRMPNPDDAEQIFQSLSIGNLLDLVVLDTRTRRDPPLDGPAIDDALRTALGPQQREWLLRQLDSSESHWRVIASPTLMAQICSDSLQLPCKQALRKLKLINPRNDGPDSDPWAGYPCERDSILRYVWDSQICNVVVLSGDVHVSFASELQFGSSGGKPVAVEFVTPSITSQNLDDKMGWGPRTDSLPIEQALTKSPSCFRWCELDSHGYVIVDVSRERILAEWWFVDEIHNACNGEKCGAAWKVETGQPRLIAVVP